MPLNLNLGGPYGMVEMTTRLLEALVEAVDETRATGLEHGFGLCLSASGRELYPGEECVGTICNIHISQKCGPRMSVGTFHTHPKGNSDPSAGDLGQTHYLSTREFPHVDCRTGVDDMLRCDSPSFLATQPTQGRLDKLESKIADFYEAWRKTGAQPEDGGLQAAREARALLGRAFDQVDRLPLDQVRSQLKEDLETRECPKMESTVAWLEENARYSVHAHLESPYSKEANKTQCQVLANHLADLESMKLRLSELKDRGPRCQEAYDKVQRTEDTLEGLKRLLFCPSKEAK